MKHARMFWIWTSIMLLVSCGGKKRFYESAWLESTTRYWIAPEVWANRWQDWQLKNGRVECIGGQYRLRTVHLLTHWLAERPGDLTMMVSTGVINPDHQPGEDGVAGFLFGAGSLDLDYRARAIIHQASGPGGGLLAGVNGTGHLVVLDNENNLALLANSEHAIQISPESGVMLKLQLVPDGNLYSLKLEAYTPVERKLLGTVSLTNIAADRLTGNIALAANGGADDTGVSFWFRDWRVFGTKVDANPEQAYGPILATMHTIDNWTLKMTAQVAPVADTDPQELALQVRAHGRGQWREVSRAKLVHPGWTATFRVYDWDDSNDYQYRVVYDCDGRTVYYPGTIRHNPVEKNEIVVAAFTGNNNTHGSFGSTYSFTSNRIWFPHQDIVTSVAWFKPDLLVYTGDQVYEGRPTRPDVSGEFSSYLDYLYKWTMFLWAQEKLLREIPSVSIPDDHDVYHGNIWGMGGKKAPKAPKDGQYPDYYPLRMHAHWQQDQGGYKMPPEFVNMVQRTQCAHLPDPYDPTPVEQGIGVYYTDLTYGGVSFAILEDRKFKSAPSVLMPQYKVINGFSQIKDWDARLGDVPGAVLLGDRQLKFLEDWAADWTDAVMKVTISQTIFANVSTYPIQFITDAGTRRLKPEPKGVIPSGYALAKDMDSNGWPQTGRNKALAAIRKAYGFMIAGDQHLGSIVHHGIDEWDDAGYSFCVPSIANLWPRRWFPPKPGYNWQEGMPRYTGSYLDGFGNHITVYAASNPFISNHEPHELHDRAPGYGIIRFNKKERTITMECWPRYSDPSKSNAEQYEGWPKTISMYDNYGRAARAWLPTLKFTGLESPVVQVIEEATSDIVYTVRARGDTFKPKVFKRTLYTLKIGEPGTDKMKTLTGMVPLRNGEEKTVTVTF